MKIDLNHEYISEITIEFPELKESDFTSKEAFHRYSISANIPAKKNKIKIYLYDNEAYDTDKIIKIFLSNKELTKIMNGIKEYLENNDSIKKINIDIN